MRGPLHPGRPRLTIRRRGAARLALALALLTTACAPPVPPRAPWPSGPFPFAEYDALLSRYTDEQGRVDYAALKQRDADTVERLYASLAATGPDKTPALYPGPGAALAYYLCAYNLLIWKNVLDHVPIEQPAAVRLDAGLYRFFRSPEFLIDGRALDLYDLEHRIIRRRFRDGRIHFALNCASAGCPILPRAAFVPEQVEQQLDRAARRFVTEPRNVRLDAERRTVTLSSLFKWYQGDFGGDAQAVLRFINHHRTAAGAEPLPPGLAIRYEPYDWRLNDRSLPR